MTSSFGYLGLTADELLAAFGAGRHKPGSGTAAALNGLLAAALIQTVIILTERSPRYADDTFAESLSSRVAEIDADLRASFEEDSRIWDRVIRGRTSRNAARERGEARLAERLGREALEEQRKATQLPIAIGLQCVELAEMALLVFDLGYRSARGDSVVAASSGIAGASGCVGIAYLNLKDFRPSRWTAAQEAAAHQLEGQIVELQNALARRIDVLKDGIQK